MRELAGELPLTYGPAGLLSIWALFFVVFVAVLVRFVAIPVFFGRRV